MCKQYIKLVNLAYLMFRKHAKMCNFYNQVEKCKYIAYWMDG